jgi:two-component system chemotaxis sensor kinase CheA
MHPPSSEETDDLTALFAQAKQQYRKKRQAEDAVVDSVPPPPPPISSPEQEPSAEDVEALFKQARAKYRENRARDEQQVSSTPEGTTQQPPVAEHATSKDKPQPKPKPPGHHRPGKSDETIRISASKLDELIQLVGELAIHAAIITESRRNDGLNTKACLHAIGLSAKITKDLHGKALSLRMQPVQGLFQRVERVIKDVARSQGKRVQVIVEGGDVELDKQVIEEIIDPLVHMVRNSVDHGLETPEVRRESGKPETGKILLQAVHDAAGVTVVLHDDGRGLNTVKIREKAIERGLMSATTTLQNKQIWQMIFEPGFSTADQVTEISGRGVGMDVVQKAVQSLGGSIDVESVEGKGTKFLISLPTSVSVIDALVIKMGDMRYAIPMGELDEIIDLAHYDQELSGDHTTVIKIRGNVVPVQSLKTYLNVKPRSGHDVVDARIPHVPAVISRTTMGTVAFEVDQVIAQQAVVVRPLSKQLEGLMGISGCTILGDGEPGMIVSLQEISRRFLQSLR